MARIALLGMEESASDRSFAGPDSHWCHAGARLEVVRVLSKEGDPTTSDGDNVAGEMLVLQPSTDTVSIGWHRRDGAWHRCGPVIVEKAPIPVWFVGPDQEIDNGEQAAVRPVPAGASWPRARALADSIARVGPAITVRLPEPHIDRARGARRREPPVHQRAERRCRPSCTGAPGRSPRRDAGGRLLA